MPAPAETKENPTIVEIKDLLSKSLSVLFERATAGGKLQILDDKHELTQPLPREGPLQDCEFGFILVHTWDWLKKKNALNGVLKDEQKVTQVAIELIRRTIQRIAARDP